MQIVRDQSTWAPLLEGISQGIQKFTEKSALKRDLEGLGYTKAEANHLSGLPKHLQTLEMNRMGKERDESAYGKLFGDKEMAKFAVRLAPNDLTKLIEAWTQGNDDTRKAIKTNLASYDTQQQAQQLSLGASGVQGTLPGIQGTLQGLNAPEQGQSRGLIGNLFNRQQPIQPQQQPIIPAYPLPGITPETLMSQPTQAQPMRPQRKTKPGKKAKKGAKMKPLTNAIIDKFLKLNNMDPKKAEAMARQYGYGA